MRNTTKTIEQSTSFESQRFMEARTCALPGNRKKLTSTVSKQHGNEHWLASQQHSLTSRGKLVGVELRRPVKFRQARILG
jgi:hypothetical protein